MSKTRVLLTVVFAAAGLAPRCFAQASFQRLGDLPGGLVSSGAASVSSDGGTVVGSSHSALGPEAYIWTMDGGLVGLGDLDGGFFASGARGVSSNGGVVVGVAHTADGTRAFRWSAATGMTLIFDPANGRMLIDANDVSPDGGTIVGTSPESGNNVAAIWRAGSGIALLAQPQESLSISTALGIDCQGTYIVGLGSTAQGLEGMYWPSPSSGQMLSDTEGSQHYSVAYATNGEIVVGFATPEYSANGLPARWTQQSGWEILPRTTTGEGHGWASAISQDGLRIVGTELTASGDWVAIVWDEGEPARSLVQLLADYGVVLEGWTLQHLTDVSCSGNVIVGQGLNPSGTLEAFRAVVPPLCRADADRSGDLNVPDIFTFLTIWFRGDVVLANYNRDCCVNAVDVFTFLEDWFAGCP